MPFHTRLDTEQTTMCSARQRSAACSGDLPDSSCREGDHHAQPGPQPAGERYTEQEIDESRCDNISLPLVLLRTQERCCHNVGK